MQYSEASRVSQDDSLARLDKSTLVYSVVFFAFLVPAHYAVSSTIYNLWRYAVIGIGLVCIALYMIRSNITVRWLSFVIAVVTYYLLSLLLGRTEGNIRLAIFYTIKLCGFVSLFEYGMSANRDKCIKGLLIASVVGCSIHYYTFLKYRYLTLGMRSIGIDLVGELTVHPWFYFTHDNGSVFYFLPTLSMIWYCAKKNEHSVLFPLGASILVLYMYWSLWTVSAMVVTLLATMSFLLIWYGKLGKLKSGVSLNLVLILGLMCCTAILLAYSDDRIVSLALRFGKDLVAGRGRIWVRAIPVIIENPLLGVGFELDQITVFRLTINHCHNIILQILYTGGVVSAIPFLIAVMNCDANRTNDEFSSKGQLFLKCTIFLLIIASTFDWYLYMPLQFVPYMLHSYTTR